MATSAITPPPGFELEQQQQATPPPGFVLESEQRKVNPAEKEAPGFLNTLGREAKSVGSAIAAMPGAIYHSFADPETEEERGELDKYGLVRKGKDSDPGRLSLGMGRMGVLPVARAAEDYYAAAHGEGPLNADSALDVAPEALGSASGNMIGAKLAEVAPAAIRRAGPPIVRGAAKTGNAVLQKAPEYAGAAVGGAIGREFGMGYPGALAGGALGRMVKGKIPAIPGENFGIPKPVYPGAPLPDNPGVFPGAHLPEHPGTFPGAPFPAENMRPAPLGLPEQAQPFRLPERMPEATQDEAPAQIIGGRGQSETVPGNEDVDVNSILSKYPKFSEDVQDIRQQPQIFQENEWPPVSPHRFIPRDEDIPQNFNKDLERHGRLARSEESREFADRNSMDKPKWLRNAEFKAQQLLEQAEQEHTNPLRGLPNVTKSKTPAYAPVGEPFGMPDDLSDTLKESIRRAQARRAVKGKL